MKPDVDNIDSQLAIQIRLIACDALLRRLVDKHSREPQKRYTFEQDQKVCLEQTYALGGYVFVYSVRQWTHPQFT